MNDYLMGKNGTFSFQSPKWCLLWILLVCNSCLIAQGFTNQSNEWIYENNTYLPGFGLVSQTIEKITIGSDTLINGRFYTQFLVSKDDPCNVYKSTEFLREEGSQVYRLSPDGVTEYKMLDVEDSVGYQMYFESIIYPGELDTAFVLIDSFGFEEAFDGTPLYMQYMTILNNQSFSDHTVYKVAQDVGFVQYGLLFPDIGTGLCDPLPIQGHSLRCFISDQDTIRFSEYDCFESSLISKAHSARMNEITLFPNPCNEKFHIPTDMSVKGIYGLDGVPRFFEQVDQAVSVDNLMSGLFIVFIEKRNDPRLYFAKIVKQ